MKDTSKLKKLSATLQKRSQIRVSFAESICSNVLTPCFCLSLLKSLQQKMGGLFAGNAADSIDKVCLCVRHRLELT